jgi:hypothetical protein
MNIFNTPLCIRDSKNNIIFNNKISALPLHEEFILSDSIKYFNDPEPCMIHRSAVMKRIYIEISDFFHSEAKKSNYQFSWSQLPTSLKKYINIHDAKTVTYTQVV